MILVLALALLSTISYADVVAPYWSGLNSNSCPVGEDKITTYTKCKELYESGVLDVSGKRTYFSENWSQTANPSHPSGCTGGLSGASGRNFYVYYNRADPGQASAGFKHVCRTIVVPPSRHWVTKGRNGGDPRCDSMNDEGTEDCSTKFELDNSDHGVRCCKLDRESHNSGNMKKNEGCAVFGGSRMRPQNNCHYPKTMRYSTALWWCESAGARLCTIKELKDNCAANTGCGLDFRTVWSSDDDANLDHSPITMIPSLKPSQQATPKLHYAGPRFHDRSMYPCTEANGASCNTVQSMNQAVHAVSCCKNTPDHMWFRHSMIPRCQRVWSASGQGLKHEDQCTKGSWYKAKHVCEANGARLCSRQELDAGCAKSTGCQFDGLLNWSNDS